MKPTVQTQNATATVRDPASFRSWRVLTCHRFATSGGTNRFPCGDADSEAASFDALEALASQPATRHNNKLNCLKGITTVRISALVFASVLIFNGALFHPHARAAIRTWDGGGLDSYWTNSFNWQNNATPASGDFLVFPAAAPRKISTNKFGADTTFSFIRIDGDGYHISGNPIKLTGGLSANPPPLGSATIHTPIIADGESQVWAMTNALSILNLEGPITLDLSNPGVPLDLSWNVAGIMNINGNIGSPDFRFLEKRGAGTVRLAGPNNSFAGAIYVWDGTLRVEGVLAQASVTVWESGTLAGSGRASGISTLGGTISPGAGGPAVLHSLSDLSFYSASLDSENLATLILDIEGPAAGIGYDQIELNGHLNLSECDLVLSVGGDLSLGQSFIILKNLDESQVVNGEFNGLPEGSVFAVSGYWFAITYHGGTGNDVVLTVAYAPDSNTSTWDGGGANPLWTNPQNWVGNVAPQPGNDLVFPANTAQKAHVNDYTPGTTFSNITFTGGGYFTSGNRITLAQSLFATSAAGTNTLNLDLTLTNAVLFSLGSTVRLQGAISGAGGLSTIGSGELFLAGSTANTFQGGLTVGGGTVTLDKDANVIAVPGPLVVGDSAGFDSVRVLRANQIADTAAVTINSAGDLNLLGFATETIGALTLRAGKISGPQATVVLNSSNVTVQAAAYPARIQTRLDLGGQTVTFNVQNGGAQPDLFITGAVANGALTKTGVGTLELSGTNTYTGETVVEQGGLVINGDNRQSGVTLAGGVLSGVGIVGTVTGNAGIAAPGDNVGTLRAMDTVALSSAATLAVQLNGTIPGANYDQLIVSGNVVLASTPLSLSFDFAPVVGNSFTILRKNSPGAVFGHFAGLWDDALFQVGTNWFTINYAGGDGNDVVLKRINAPAHTDGITQIGGGQIQITGTGEPGASYAVQANADLNTTNWIVIGNAVAQPNGTLVFNDTDAPNHPRRFYRFSAP